MARYLLGFFAALLATLAVAQSSAMYDNNIIIERPILEYDFLMLSQQWPQTGCWDLNKLWPKDNNATCSKCKMPQSQERWTAHGLWPSNHHGKEPFFCNTTAKYDAKLLNSTLRAAMNEKWPSYKLHHSNNDLWKHEWEKHGTCTMDLEETKTLPRYFAKAVQLIDQYNLGPALQKESITPDARYKFKDVLAAADKFFGVNLFITCATDTVTHEQYLHEVHVCFDKKFQLIDCADEHKTDCKTDAVIVYPKMLKTC